jgi:hypothetical protein
MSVRVCRGSMLACTYKYNMEGFCPQTVASAGHQRESLSAQTRVHTPRAERPGRNGYLPFRTAFLRPGQPPMYYKGSTRIWVSIRKSVSFSVRRLNR